MLRGYRSITLISSLSLGMIGYATGGPLGFNEDAGAIELAGDAIYLALPISALGYAAYLDDKQGIQALGSSYFATMGTTHLLKRIVNRQRPNSGNHSFPSGHTASAFSGAAFLQKRYGWQLGAPAYAMAAFTGYSRVQAKKHYWSDVFAGAALATGINHWLVSPLEGEASLSLMSDFQGGWQLSFAKQF